MSKLTVIDHPLVQHKLSHLRDKRTGSKEFRELVEEIAMLLTYEATRDLPLEETMVETPVAMAKTYTLAGRKLGIVPILRAGLGMVDGMLCLIPAAKWATSACTATPQRSIPWIITANCRRM